MHRQTRTAWEATIRRERARRRAARWAALPAAVRGLLYPALCLWRGTGGYRWPS